MHALVWYWPAPAGGVCVPHTCPPCNQLAHYRFLLARPSCRPTQHTVLESLSSLSEKLQAIADDGTADDYQPHAHKGFLAYFLTIEPKVTEALGKVALDGRQRRLWIAGHSMGGAVSFCAAYVYTAYRDALLRFPEYTWLRNYTLSGAVALHWMVLEPECSAASAAWRCICSACTAWCPLGSVLPLQARLPNDRQHSLCLLNQCMSPLLLSFCFAGVFTWGAPQLASADDDVRELYEAAAQEGVQVDCTTLQVGWCSSWLQPRAEACTRRASHMPCALAQGLALSWVATPYPQLLCICLPAFLATTLLAVRPVPCSACTASNRLAAAARFGTSRSAGPTQTTQWPQCQGIAWDSSMLAGGLPNSHACSKQHAAAVPAAARCAE